MSITVKFFARLREELDLDELTIEAVSGMTAMDVWYKATGQSSLPAKTLIAVNQEYAAQESEVNENDEVAFFPPVTGG